MNLLPVGCNTLYPFGRLPQDETVFDFAAQRRAVEVIAEAGGDGCEFSHFQHLTVDECGELRQVCAETGIVPWSAHSWVSLPATVAAVAERGPWLKESIEKASALGASVMVVHAQGFQGDPDEEAVRNARRAAVAAMLTEIAPQAADGDLKLGIENCADRRDLEFLVETVASLALPSVGFNIDTGHAVLHGMAPAEAIDLMGERLVTTHLQDNLGERDDHLPPGRGTLDWRSVLTALRRVDYQGMLMIEISDRPAGREPDPPSETAAAVDFVRALQRR